MLYKFKSTTGDLTMLEPNGKQVLEIIGKETGPKGIITPEQMPGAIRALEAAIAGDAGQAPTVTAGKDEDHAENVALKQRAIPFIALLKRCQAAGEEITWGA